MSKFLDKIMATFQTATTSSVEEELSPPVERANYLTDSSLATAQPFYTFNSVGDIRTFLGIGLEEASKTKGQKAMELHSHHDHLSGIKTFIISGQTVEMAAIFKWPQNSQQAQLDAIIISEGHGRTCIACGQNDASRECVDMFLDCFRKACQTLQNDISGQKSHAEADLQDQLAHAYHFLTMDRIMTGLTFNPSPTRTYR